MVFVPSTFGASTKAPSRIFSDDKYAVAKVSKNWVGFDEHGCNHSRIRLASTLGKCTDTPSPAQYTPNDEVKSRREIGPKVTIANKYRDVYYDDVEEHKKARELLEKFTVPKDTNKTKRRPRNEKEKAHVSAIPKFNLEDMKNGKKWLALNGPEPLVYLFFIYTSFISFYIALLPGPGSYDSNFDKIVKFNRQPQACLASRVGHSGTRSVLDFQSLDLLTERHKAKCHGEYDLTRDPLKKKTAYTIGEKRILRNQPGEFVRVLC